jgi:hypothetical protein
MVPGEQKENALFCYRRRGSANDCASLDFAPLDRRLIALGEGLDKPVAASSALESSDIRLVSSGMRLNETQPHWCATQALRILGFGR